MINHQTIAQPQQPGNFDPLSKKPFDENTSIVTTRFTCTTGLGQTVPVVASLVSNPDSGHMAGECPNCGLEVELQHPFWWVGEISERTVLINAEMWETISRARASLSLTGAALFEMNMPDISTRYRVGLIEAPNMSNQLEVLVAIDGSGAAVVPFRRLHPNYLAKVSSNVIACEFLSWLLEALAPMPG